MSALDDAARYREAVKEAPEQAVSPSGSSPVGAGRPEGRKDDGGKPRLDLFPYDLVFKIREEAGVQPILHQAGERELACAWWRRELSDVCMFQLLRSSGTVEEIADRVVPVLEHGCAKYGAWNWWKGMAWSRLFAAWLRHWREEGTDPDTGLPHADHALCCLLFLCCYALAGRGEDDRPG